MNPDLTQQPLVVTVPALGDGVHFELKTGFINLLPRRAASCLLLERSPLPNKTTVPSLPEACVRRVLHSSKAPPLLHVAPHISGERGSTLEHPQQPERYGSRLHVGH